MLLTGEALGLILVPLFRIAEDDYTQDIWVQGLHINVRHDDVLGLRNKISKPRESLIAIENAYL